MPPQKFPSFFIFSSRGRTTRYWGDWSSDVCSSDLLRLKLSSPRRSCASCTPSSPPAANGIRSSLPTAPTTTRFLSPPDQNKAAHQAGGFRPSRASCRFACSHRALRALVPTGLSGPMAVPSKVGVAGVGAELESVVQRPVPADVGPPDQGEGQKERT